MKKIILMNYILWALGMFLSTALFAQEPIKIFYLRGEANVIHLNQKTPCTRGMEITNGTLSVPSGSIVILVSENGQNLKISDPGDYPYDKLIKLYQSADGNLTQDYFKYVWSQMSDGGDDKKIAEVRSSVYRGDIGMFLPPDSCVIYEFQVPFTWRGGHESQYFYLWSGEQKLLGIETRDSALTMDMDSYLFEPGKYYQWEVATTNPPPANTPRNTFTVLSSREAKNADMEFKKLESDIADYPSDVQYSMKASFYAERKMYMKAIEQFEIGLYVAEDKAFLEDLYAEFLAGVMGL